MGETRGEGRRRKRVQKPRTDLRGGDDGGDRLMQEATEGSVIPPIIALSEETPSLSLLLGLVTTFIYVFHLPGSVSAFVSTSAPDQS